MAASAWAFTNEGKKDLFAEDFETDNHYMVICTSALTPALTHSTFADISANECADPDYAAQDLAGEAITQTGGTVTLDANDVSFGATVSITGKYAYIMRGTAAGKTGTDRIVCYSDLNSGGGSVSSTNGSFAVNNHANGIATAT